MTTARPTSRVPCATGTTSSTTCCSPRAHHRELLAVVDWEMAGIGDPLVDLAWALIFHPGPEGTLRLGMAREPTFHAGPPPRPPELIERYTARLGPRHVRHRLVRRFARWKLALVLEGSYAKFQRGQSDKPIHEFFGTPGRPVAGQRRRHHRPRRYDMTERMQAWQVTRRRASRPMCSTGSRSTCPNRGPGRSGSG